MQTLDAELARWHKQGWRIVSRSESAAQVFKPKDSPLLVGVIIWPVFLGVWTLLVLPFMWAAALFVVGVVILAAWHAVRGEKQAYLTVNPDGTITES